MRSQVRWQSCTRFAKNRPAACGGTFLTCPCPRPGKGPHRRRRQKSRRVGFFAVTVCGSAVLERGEKSKSSSSFRRSPAPRVLHGSRPPAPARCRRHDRHNPNLGGNRTPCFQPQATLITIIGSSRLFFGVVFRHERTSPCRRRRFGHRRVGRRSPARRVGRPHHAARRPTNCRRAGRREGRRQGPQRAGAWRKDLVRHP
jgi:hypothetical protein